MTYQQYYFLKIISLINQYCTILNLFARWRYWNNGANKNKIQLISRKFNVPFRYIIVIYFYRYSHICAMF